MSPIWLNGTLCDSDEPNLRVTDRGFTLADGVFETIRANGPEPLWLGDHLKRLNHGASEMGLLVPFDAGTLAEAIGQLLARTNHRTTAIRLTLSRGPVAARGLWPSGDAGQPTCLLTVAAASPPQEQDVVISDATRRNEYSPLSRIKSLNYGDNIIAKREAIRRGASDALLLNTKGRIACATAGNVFFRIDRRWITPPITEGILPGLARRRLLDLLDGTESIVTREIAATCDSAFISNSLGCALVRMIDGRVLDHQLDQQHLNCIFSS